MVALSSRVMGFSWKNSLRAGGKQASVCDDHEWGVCFITVVRMSRHHVLDSEPVDAYYTLCILTLEFLPTLFAIVLLQLLLFFKGNLGTLCKGSIVNSDFAIGFKFRP